MHPLCAKGRQCFEFEENRYRISRRARIRISVTLRFPHLSWNRCSTSDILPSRTRSLMACRKDSIDRCQREKMPVQSMGSKGSLETGWILYRSQNGIVNPSFGSHVHPKGNRTEGSTRRVEPEDIPGSPWDSSGSPSSRGLINSRHATRKEKPDDASFRSVDRGLRKNPLLLRGSQIQRRKQAIRPSKPTERTSGIRKHRSVFRIQEPSSKAYDRGYLTSSGDGFAIVQYS